MTNLIADGGGQDRGASAGQEACVVLVVLTGSTCSNDELDRSKHGTDDTEHHERGDLQRSQLQRLH